MASLKGSGFTDGKTNNMETKKCSLMMMIKMKMKMKMMMMMMMMMI